MRRALRSLPWYLLASYLFVPAICSVFTFGASLIWYVLPFAIFFRSDRYPGQFQENLMLASLPFIPGLIFWFWRQFLSAAAAAHRRNRFQPY